MKILILFGILQCTVLSSQAQKFFFNNCFKETTDSLNAEFYQIKLLVNDTIVEKYYFMNDTLYEVRLWNKNKFPSREGMNIVYYPNGQVRYMMHYNNNLLNGEVRGYYENGNLKRLDHYNNGLLQDGKCFSLTGQDTAYIIFEKPARYLGGGLDVFYGFVMKNTKYPQLAVENGIEGKVIVGFFVNSLGEVENVRAISSPDEILSRAAEDAVQKSGLWEPAEREGKKCIQSFYLPVIFSLGIKNNELPSH